MTEENSTKRNELGWSVGIDASNIRQGGGVTHLRELLNAAHPEKFGFGRVVVWGGEDTLVQIADRSWLKKVTGEGASGSLLRRAVWQSFELGGLATREGCDVLFVPGGSFATNFRPIVTMHQNMLPFSWREASRYGISAKFAKMVLLRWTQARSFRKADRTIFLSKHSYETVRHVAGDNVRGVVVPHGANQSVRMASGTVRRSFSSNAPARIVYVSALEPYKHHKEVMIAVARLRADGFPLVLDIIGQGDARTTGSIHKLARELDPAKAYLKLVGPLAQGDVYVRYREADVVVFASTCEALPNIVIEAMLCGSTIACSDSRPMPDILEEAGQYFDATDPETIGHAIRTLLEKPELRVRLANKAAKKAQSYSWEKCADDTFAVFREVVLGKKM